MKWALFALASAAVSGAIVGKWLAKRAQREPAGVFVLAIKLRVAQGRMPEVLDHWAPLAAHVRANEPNCYSYEAAVSDRDENVLLILERYKSKDDLLDPHQKSAPFLEFKKWLEASGAVIEKEGMSYIESNLGYVNRECSAPPKPL